MQFPSSTGKGNNNTRQIKGMGSMSKKVRFDSNSESQSDFRELEEEGNNNACYFNPVCEEQRTKKKKKCNGMPKKGRSLDEHDQGLSFYELSSINTRPQRYYLLRARGMKTYRGICLPSS